MVSTNLSSLPPASSARTSPLHLTSSDVNRLLYCYLLESNLVHSAFTFSLEAKLASLPDTGRNIPRGELLRWLHRGLAWKEVEHHVNAAEEAFGSPVPPCSASFDLIHPHVCVPVGPQTPSPSSSRIPLPSTQQPITLPLGSTSTLAAPPPAQRNELFPEPSADDEQATTTVTAAAAVVGSSNAKGKRKAVNGAGDKHGDPEDEASAADGKPAAKKEGAGSGAGGGNSSKRPRVDKDKKEDTDVESAGASSKSSKAASASVAAPKPPPLPSFQRKSASTHPSNNRPTSSSSSTSSSKPTSPSTTFSTLPTPSNPSTSASTSTSTNPTTSAPKKTSTSATTSPVMSTRTLAPTSASGTSKKKKKPSSSTSTSSQSSAFPTFVDKAPGEDYTNTIRTVSLSLDGDRSDPASAVEDGAVDASGKKTGKDKVAKANGKGRGKARIFGGEHTGEVFVCKFSPVQQSGGGEVLATGAGDATVRLWDFQPPGASGSSDPEGWTLEKPPATCKHMPVTDRKDITSIDFNPPGTLFGTSSYDGIARLWTPQGELHGVLTRHSGAIFCLKFNPTGSLLATAGSDGSVCIWESASAKIRQSWQINTDCTLYLDWLDDENLASCSMDKTLCVLRVGAFSPLRTFRGHTDEVNRVAWSPAPPNWSATSNLPSPAPLVATGGRVLASCSDDMTVRIWSCDAEPAPGSDDGGFQNGRLEKYCKGVLRGHEKEIYTMGFSPSTVGSSSSVPLLATASFDYTVRLWDLSALTCLRVLRAHTETVFSISFSPTGRHLASAGWDKLMVVWEVESGKPVRHRAGEAGIFEVEWSKNAGAGVVAVCQSDKAVVLVDVKELE